MFFRKKNKAGLAEKSPELGKPVAAKAKPAPVKTTEIATEDYSRLVDKQIDKYVRDTIHKRSDMKQWLNKATDLKGERRRVFDVNSQLEIYSKWIARSIKASRAKQPRLLSLGSGDCDLEISITKALIKEGCEEFIWDATEISPVLIERGLGKVKEAGFEKHFNFLEADLNNPKFKDKYAGVIAHHALHHFIELEKLFDAVHDAMEITGVFVTNDMIGRNGHMRWPEALAVVDSLWRLLPDEKRFSERANRVVENYVNLNCCTDSFEGIRAQDILPELIKRFHFRSFHASGGITDAFLNKTFSQNFDPESEQDQNFMLFLSRLNVLLIDLDYIKPTIMAAVMTRSDAEPAKLGIQKVFRNWTPEKCVRDPFAQPKSNAFYRHLPTAANRAYPNDTTPYTRENDVPYQKALEAIIERHADNELLENLIMEDCDLARRLCNASREFKNQDILKKWRPRTKSVDDMTIFAEHEKCLLITLVQETSEMLTAQSDNRAVVVHLKP